MTILCNDNIRTNDGPPKPIAALQELFTFRTARDGRWATTGIVVLGRDPENDAHQLYQYADPIEDGCAAWGKVAFATADHWGVYQLDGRGGTELTACGNAVGAIVKILHGRFENTFNHITVRTFGGTIKAKVGVQDGLVTQTWWLDSVHVQQISETEATVTAVGLPRYIVTFGEEPIHDSRWGSDAHQRYAYFDPVRRQTSFRTLNGSRIHKGVPLTGLLAVSLASQRLAQLRKALAESQEKITLKDGSQSDVPHVWPNGRVILPSIQVTYERCA